MSAHIKEQTLNIGELIRTIKSSFIRYDIPKKNGMEINGWALAWPSYYDNGEIFHSQAEIEEIFADNLSDAKYQSSFVTKDIFIKFRNSRDYFIAGAKNAINCIGLSSQFGDLNNH